MIQEILSPAIYDTVVGAMIVTAVIVFIALHFVTAGYGSAYTKRWGPAVNNRFGWILMEAPAFILMLLLWIFSPRANQIAPCVMASLFMLHYFQRTFIFPLLIRGKSKMPFSIILMGFTFNTINAYMLGGWLFYLAPADLYTPEWLYNPLFILGTIIFFCGMAVNIHSDHVIRNLRRPGDTKHYIPRGGMYKYVTSANYFGEFTEWVGFAILTWSVPGAVFALWTFANLAPRARSLQKRYIAEFGDEYRNMNLKYIIPFIY